MPETELFLDFEPEANAATAKGGLTLTGSERNATMNCPTCEKSELFLSFSPSARPYSISIRFCQGWRT